MSEFNNDRPYYITPKTNQIVYYLSKGVGAANEYVEIIDIIRTAAPNTDIRIYLNTPGGCIATGAQFIHAMQQSQGIVTAILDGEVCSLGSLLFLAADQQEVNPYSSLMLHTYSSRMAGKGNELDSELEHRTPYIKNLFMDIYYPFLSKKEINQLMDGKDFWFAANQVISRLKKSK